MTKAQLLRLATWLRDYREWVLDRLPLTADQPSLPEALDIVLRAIDFEMDKIS